MNKFINIFRKNSFISSALWFTIGSFVLKGINFITMPLFTSLLGPSGFGSTTMFTTWLSIFSCFIGLGISGTIASASANIKDPKEYKEYLSSTVFLSTLSFLSILGLSFIFRNLFVTVMGFSYNLIILMIIQSFFAFIVDFASNVYIFDKDHKKYLLVSFLMTIINILLSVLFIINLDTDKYLGRVYGMSVSTILIGIFLYIKILFNGKVLLSKKHWKFCLPIALPIIFHSLSHLVLNQADRIMLKNYFDESTVGIYSAAYNIGIILNIIHMSINNSWVPWYFDALDSKNKESLRKTALSYMSIFSVFTILFVIGSPEVLKIMTPTQPEFWTGVTQTPLVILGYYFVFLYTFSVNYEFYIKNTKYIAIGTITASISNILLNLILIPSLGGLGAAIATAVSYLILFLIHEFIVRVKFKHVDFEFKWYILNISMVLISIVFTEIFINMFLIRLLAGLTILILAIIYFKKIFQNKLNIFK